MVTFLFIVVHIAYKTATFNFFFQAIFQYLAYLSELGVCEFYDDSECELKARGHEENLGCKDAMPRI
jgi:hypothetical protein